MNLWNISIKDMLERMVCQYPDRIVVKAEGGEYTWRDIDRGSSVIAGELFALGVRSGSHVALCGSNSVNWILTFFAIQRIGAVAVLLNPQLSPEEITGFSKLGDITHFCLGKTPFRDRKHFSKQVLDQEGSQITAILDVGDEHDFLKDPVTSYPDVDVTQDDPCVIIFTSGSTATPKCVQLSSFYLLNSSNYCVHNLNMTTDDKECAILPLYHIFGLTAVLFPCLICGSLMILPHSTKPGDLMHLLKDEQCTILHAVPTFLIRLVNAPGFSPQYVSSIRVSYMSGAPISKAQLKILMDRFPNNHFIRRYGLTEMAPISLLDPKDDIDHVLNTVGKPVEGTTVRIIDMETGSICQVGVQGEIVAKGRFHMSGYYKQPQDKQPFDEDGFLHTGDLGFLDEEGYLHFTGRVKDIIIRGGENIMPNEVASAISLHDNIVDVKVLGVPDEIYGEIVAAAVVLKEEVSFDGKEMRDYLMTKLARYKIPAYFFIYEELPTLANGKIDALSLKQEIISRLSNIG